MRMFADANKESTNNTYTRADGHAQFAGKHCLLSHFSAGWIIDSGALDHICCDIKLFTEYNLVNGIDNTIIIHDGSKIKITHKGIVKLDECITLRNVLFIPEFQFNLIVITMLCGDMNYSIVFTNDSCVIKGASPDSTNSSWKVEKWASSIMLVILLP